jgi:hypothetical protein
MWSDGSPIDYQNFKEGEPNTADEKCVEMVHAWGYQWNDAFCTNTRAFICKAQKCRYLSIENQV